MVLLIGNYTTRITPAWALNPGTGKVKVVSVYFYLERKMESNHVGLMEEGRACSLRDASWEAGALSASQPVKI